MKNFIISKNDHTGKKLVNEKKKIAFYILLDRS